MKNKKLSLYKTFIIILGFSSVLLLYTQNIYIYDKLSIKSLGLGMWIGIVLWILFLINASILTVITNKNEEHFIRIRNVIRNFILLILITILFVYLIGSSLLKLYQMNTSMLVNGLYIAFGFVFVIYIVITYIVNRMEDKDKIEKKRILEESKNTKKRKNK